MNCKVLDYLDGARWHKKADFGSPKAPSCPLTPQGGLKTSGLHDGIKEYPKNLRPVTSVQGGSTVGLLSCLSKIETRNANNLFLPDQAPACSERAVISLLNARR
jgi:hypothetical protein